MRLFRAQETQVFRDCKNGHVGHVRVLRIIARMNVGGPAIQVVNLMEGLPEEVFEQRLVTGFCGPDEVDYLELHRPGVEITRLSGLGRAIQPREDALVLLKMIKEIRRFRPHIIHTHTAKAGAIGRIAAKMSGSRARRIHTFHGHLLHGYFGPTKTRALVEAERMLARTSTRLVAVGEVVREELLRVGVGHREQYRVVAPGIEIGELRSQEHARRELGVPEGGPVIAFIGRLTGIKRPDRFLEVAWRVSQEHPNSQFLVAGDGDLLADMRREAACFDLSIHFLGMQNEIEMCLAASDAVILTSDNEGTPISLIEAGLAGKPVVASDVGSVREVVQDGQTGWLAKPDAGDLAACALELLRNPMEANRRANNARSFTRGKFGLRRFLSDYEHLYREALNEPTST